MLSKIGFVGSLPKLRGKKPVGLMGRTPGGIRRPPSSHPIPSGWTWNLKGEKPAGAMANPGIGKCPDGN